ncbi:MAG: hypothetical protein STHCBS139747_008051 [Sporothrix thermara]
MAAADHDSNVDIDVDELDSAAIAAAMGFSSFGTQAHPNKKRRFNPQADAVIGSPRDSRPPAQLPGVGTGANATRLPPRPPAAPAAPAVSIPPPTAPAASSLPVHPPHSGRAAMKLPPPTATNADEIDLGEDDNDNDNENDDGDEPGPQYLDTSRPVGEVRDHLGLQEGDDKGEGGAPAEEDSEALQARINAVIAAGNAAYGLPPRPPQHQLDGAGHSTGRQHDAGVGAHDRHGFRPDLMPAASRQAAAVVGGLGAGGGVADGEVAGSETNNTTAQHSQGAWQGHGGQGQGGRGPGRGHGHGHGHGHQRDWWTGYYDPTSNENPWARVEAKLGLPACAGSWLERGHGPRPDTRAKAAADAVAAAGRS